MQKCILGMLRSKTRILCTHRIEFVEKADLVVLMDNGTVVKTGIINITNIIHYSSVYSI